MESKKNTKRGIANVVVSIFNQLISLVLGLIIPRLILVNLGSETNGLLSTVSQILVYVYLLEAGVGMASLQALYKPVAGDDKESINRILAATNKFYKKTGAIYFLVVAILSLVSPWVINTELPKLTVGIVILLSGLPSCISFLFQGKYLILLQAEGKDYIRTSLTMVTSILINASKIVLLLLGFDVIAIQLSYTIIYILQVVYIVMYIRRKYKWINLDVEPDYEAVSGSKNVLVHQVSGLIFDNTDAIILSFFCGLKVVSVYALYQMVLKVVDNFIANFAGLNFILGQNFNKDRENYLKLHDAYEVFMMTLAFALFSIAFIFIKPFMLLYTAGVTDINYMDEYLPYLFIISYLLLNSRVAPMRAIEFAKHFKQTQWHAVVEMTINLTVSIVSVAKFGLYGVLFGTIAALLFRANAMIIYGNKVVLNRSPWITYRRWLINLAVFVAVSAASMKVLNSVQISSYIYLIGYAAIATIAIVPLFFAVAWLTNRKVFKYALTKIRNR